MLKRHLQALIDIAPYLEELIDEEISFAIMNNEQYLLTQNTKNLTNDIKAGDPHTFDEGMLEILKSKKKVVKNMPATYFKVPVKTVLTPVINDDGESADTMVIVCKDISKQVEIDELIQSLSSSFEQINKGTEDIAADSQSLAAFVNDMMSFAEETQKKISEIDSIIQVIKNISSQSNLLALNASIEAARAGEAGRGFSVVATEMGKLSKLSKDSADKVASTLTSMKNAFETITGNIGKISNSSESQVAATQQISSTVNDVFSAVKHLAEVAKVAGI